MRILISLCFVAILTACHNEAKPPATESPKKSTKYAGILAKCKPITIDTFRVHYDESVDSPSGISDSYPFKGILLDSMEATLFPREVVLGPMENSSGIYACYSFAIDAGHTGIIVRTPSMYESMSVKFFTLDNEQDTLTDFAELANFEGDGGESGEKVSWLYRDKNRNLHAYLWELNIYDHSVQDESDTIVEKDDYYYVLNLSKSKFDTINSNAENLLKTFQAVKRK